MAPVFSRIAMVPPVNRIRKMMGADPTIPSCREVKKLIKLTGDCSIE
ncbi:hypothetical protein BSMD_033150 [Bacillus subtilis Miyagi-4]|nr:hypothetical protein BSMD_033150 [Bacillus subtilis Miyagi-4]